MKKKTIFISMPMKDKTEDEIKQQFGRVKKELTEWGYEVIDSIIFPDKSNLGEDCLSDLYYLGESIKKLSYCNYIYFCKGWNKARGCKIEYQAALDYGLEIIYE